MVGWNEDHTEGRCKNDELSIYFQPDGVIRFNGKDVILEIKTESTYQFTARYNAERVARTETKRVTYCAHDDVYKDTGVEELRYRCANGGDSRTCQYCRADNGKVFKRGEEPNSEVRRYMEECLFENEHITGVQDLEVSQIKDVLHIKFTLVTDVGSKEVEMDV